MSLLQERIGELVNEHGSYRGAGKVLGVDWAYLKRIHDGSMCNPSYPVCEKIGLTKKVTVEFFRLEDT